jgi:hypothetical protein
MGVNPDEIKLVMTEEECFGFEGPVSRIRLSDGQEFLVAGEATSVILATRGIDAYAREMMKT